MKKKLSAYLELVKPGILVMSLLMTVLGYYLARGGNFHLSPLLILLLGTGLAYAGGAVLNHYLERDLDALMERTRTRPLPTGLIPAEHALTFGILLVLLGLLILLCAVGLLCAFLTLLTVFLYVLVYTPLKTVTWWNTTIGAVPGALPPLIGWSAGAGSLDFGGWILFLILFIWQHPHFYAIAWIHKEDYQRAGIKMLPVVDPSGQRTTGWILFYILFLIFVSLLPTTLGLSSGWYFLGTLIIGLLMLQKGYLFKHCQSLATARGLFRMSLYYLPALYALILMDARFFSM